MTCLNECSHKHNFLSIKTIVIILAISLILSLYPFANVLEEYLDKNETTMLFGEQGNSAVEQNQDDLAMLKSAVIIHVACDDPRYEDRGLGTVIGDHTIVTAKHVIGMAIGRQEIPGLQINDSSVSGLIKVRYSYFSDQGETSGTDIMRIELPLSSDPLTVAARFASQEAINSIGIGTWLSVVYYDHSSKQLRVGKFRVVETGDGLAKLEDPLKIIVPGDSGGGVYYDGGLVGMTTSIINAISTIEVGGKAVEQKQYQGEFWVTFISPAFR